MPENEQFDLIVVGGGSAGYAAARTFHEHGGRVAVIDGAPQAWGFVYSQRVHAIQNPHLLGGGSALGQAG